MLGDPGEFRDAEPAGEVVSGFGGVSRDTWHEGVVAVENVVERVGLVASQVIEQTVGRAQRGLVDVPLLTWLDVLVST